MGLIWETTFGIFRMEVIILKETREKTSEYKKGEKGKEEFRTKKQAIRWRNSTNLIEMQTHVVKSSLHEM